MKLIAHRGNIYGPSSLDNHPERVERALEEGFDVEIDVWYSSGSFFLGHDYPLYEVAPSFFREGMWCHAKNYEALVKLHGHKGIELFWHDKDKFTLTSGGYIWTYPEQPVGPKSVIVMPELYTNISFVANDDVYGICSDYVRILHEARNI